MVLDRATRSWKHSQFGCLPDWLRDGDVLVRNDARVIRARLRGERSGGGEVEVLLLKREGTEPDGEVWSCLARPGRRLRRGGSALLRGDIEATWLDEADRDGIRRVRLAACRPILEILEAVGEVPLPPYIRRAPSELDAVAYQTVYARQPCAVAAPTAGLHFTTAGLAALAARGIEIVSLTLEVGAGTFLPIREGRPRAPPPGAGARGDSRVHGASRKCGEAHRPTGRCGRHDDGSSARGIVRRCGSPGARGRRIAVHPPRPPLPRRRRAAHQLPSAALARCSCWSRRSPAASACSPPTRGASRERYRFYSYGDAMLIRERATRSRFEVARARSHGSGAPARAARTTAHGRWRRRRSCRSRRTAR